VLLQVPNEFNVNLSPSAVVGQRLEEGLKLE
jgi:hypothetical protein